MKQRDFVTNHHHELNGTKIVIGEVGWPSAGPTVCDAVPSPENQVKFFSSFLDHAYQQQYLLNQKFIEEKNEGLTNATEPEKFQFFVFSAFDEDYKSDKKIFKFVELFRNCNVAPSESDEEIEKNWGMFDRKTREMKKGLEELDIMVNGWIDDETVATVSFSVVGSIVSSLVANRFAGILFWQ